MANEEVRALATWLRAFPNAPNEWNASGIIAILEAEVTALRRINENNESQRIAELEASLRDAMKQCSEWARQAGEAKGRLEMSEAAGIVDGWREKCEGLEAEVARLREALLMHNDALRSAAAIADRNGEATNWLPFRGQCHYTLAEYHELVNEARAAVQSGD